MTSTCHTDRVSCLDTSRQTKCVDAKCIRLSIVVAYYNVSESVSPVAYTMYI